MSDMNSTNTSSQPIAMGVYILYLIGAFSGIFWLAGFLLAFVFRGRAATGSLAARHLAHQVRVGLKLIIAGLVAVVAYFLLVATLVGVLVAWLPLLAWCVWAVVVSVKGISALAGERDPG